MRRGFKTEAIGIGREVREELGLGLTDPLDPWRLADNLAVRVLPLSSLEPQASSAVRLFSGREKGAFSGLTVWDGATRLIVINDAHSKGRQANDLAHELSHALLQHPAVPALDHTGCRDWQAELEEEATWLAGVLLIPEEAAIMIVRNGWDLRRAADYYQVSQVLVKWRINITGARTRVQRWGRK